MELNLEPQGTMDVHCIVNGPIQTNTYIAVSAGEAIMVDPAWEGEKLFEMLAERHPGVVLKAVICTHGHADHIGGVAGVLRAAGEGVDFLISETDAAIMADAIRDMRAGWGFDHELPPAPTRLLHEGDTVTFGDVTLQVLATPGHTPGGIVLFAATEKGNIAFMGDTLFPGAHGRTDLAGGSEKEIILSLGKLGTLLPPSTLCLIGHNDTTTIAAELEGNFFMRRGLRRFAKE